MIGIDRFKEIIELIKKLKNRELDKSSAMELYVQIIDKERLDTLVKDKVINIFKTVIDYRPA